jgi:hypothetical protein
MNGFKESRKMYFQLLSCLFKPVKIEPGRVGHDDAAKITVFLPPSLQTFQGFLHCVMDLCEFGNSHHVKDFLKMVRKAGDADMLVILFCFGKELDQDCNAAAVNIGILIEF